MKRVNLQDVADHLGVSKMTVSLYIRDPDTNRVSEELKRRIHQAIGELRYRPPLQSQFSARSGARIVAILIPFNLPLFKYEQVNDILNGVQEELFARDYSFIFLHVGEDRGTPVLDKQILLKCRSFDGVILFGTRYSREDSMAASLGTLRENGIPYALVNMPELPILANQVVVENTDLCNPFEYLISLGHRKIVFVGGYPDSPQTSRAVAEYRATLRTHGIEVSENFILDGGYERLASYKALEGLLREGRRFSAVYGHSMQMTAGVYGALRDRGVRIPQDVSVIGYGDPYYTELLEPALTTVHPPFEECGRRSVRLLFETIAKGGTERKAFLQNQLIIRKSATPPRSKDRV